MSALVPKKLICKRKQDIRGVDEWEIHVNNLKIWDGTADKNQTISLVGKDSHEFTDEAQVKLIERDPNSSKQIGQTKIIRSSSSGDTAVFKTSGAWYEFDYDVEA